VRIVEFDIARLRADRDQLWAEAAHCEAAGASIRLDPTLYPVAAVEQEDRRSDDPMELVIAKAFGESTGKVLTTDAWWVLGIERACAHARRDDPVQRGHAQAGVGEESEPARTGSARILHLRGDSEQRKRWLSVTGKGEFAQVTPAATEKARGPTLVGLELREAKQ
jgi:predicted P-loop ATPase